MIEVRHSTVTGKITGWCGDKSQFGNLDRDRINEKVIILPIPLPSLSTDAYLIYCDVLINNPKYVPPSKLSLTFVPSNPSHDPPAKIAHIEDFLRRAYP